MYPRWFYIPGVLLFVVIFIIPTAAAFYYSLTRWTLFDSTFIGLDNFGEFLQDDSLTSGLRNTFVYAVVTSGSKVVLGLLLATLLTSRIHLRSALRLILLGRERSTEEWTDAQQREEVRRRGSALRRRCADAASNDGA